MFGQIDIRLRQIFKEDVPFGNKNIVLFGDFNQLPPVGDKFIFLTNDEEPYSKIIGNCIWSSFMGFELTEIMRQKDDAQFAMALNRLAVGQLTTNDVAMFQTREKHKIKCTETTSKVIHLFKTNDEVDKFNMKKILNNTNTVEVHEAIDTFTDNHSESVKNSTLKYLKNSKSQSTFGLATFLHLSKGIQYMLTNNIMVTDGLVNGAVGQLMLIQRDISNNIDILWLFFDDLTTGKQTREEHKALFYNSGINTNWTPIKQLKEISSQKKPLR